MFSAQSLFTRTHPEEFRLFFLAGKFVFASPYREKGDYRETDLPTGLFAGGAANVKSNFFTMDVAQKTGGDRLIVELGDAQVAGLPEKTDENQFYKSIVISLENRRRR